MAAVHGWYPLEKGNLHASPDAPVTRRETAEILTAYFGQKLFGQEAIDYVVKQGWMAVDHRNWFHADLPLYWTDIREDQLPRRLALWHMRATGPVSRAELARRLTGGK
jgi:hypothetical protein